MQESAQEREHIAVADCDHEAELPVDLSWAKAIRTGCWFLGVGLVLAAIACLTEGGLYWPHWVN